jgi:hypothetical protein
MQGMGRKNKAMGTLSVILRLLSRRIFFPVTPPSVILRLPGRRIFFRVTPPSVILRLPGRRISFPVTPPSVILRLLGRRIFFPVTPPSVILRLPGRRIFFPVTPPSVILRLPGRRIFFRVALIQGVFLSSLRFLPYWFASAKPNEASVVSSASLKRIGSGERKGNVYFYNRTSIKEKSERNIQWM